MKDYSPLLSDDPFLQKVIILVEEVGDALKELALLKTYEPQRVLPDFAIIFSKALSDILKKLAAQEEALRPTDNRRGSPIYTTAGRLRLEGFANNMNKKMAEILSSNSIPTHPADASNAQAVYNWSWNEIIYPVLTQTSSETFKPRLHVIDGGLSPS